MDEETLRKRLEVLTPIQREILYFRCFRGGVTIKALGKRLSISESGVNNDIRSIKNILGTEVFGNEVCQALKELVGDPPQYDLDQLDNSEERGEIEPRTAPDEGKSAEDEVGGQDLKEPDILPVPEPALPPDFSGEESGQPGAGNGGGNVTGAVPSTQPGERRNIPVILSLILASCLALVIMGGIAYLLFDRLQPDEVPTVAAQAEVPTVVAQAEDPTEVPEVVATPDIGAIQTQAALEGAATLIAQLTVASSELRVTPTHEPSSTQAPTDTPATTETTGVILGHCPETADEAATIFGGMPSQWRKLEEPAWRFDPAPGAPIDNLIIPEGMQGDWWDKSNAGTTVGPAEVGIALEATIWCVPASGAEIATKMPPVQRPPDFSDLDYDDEFSFGGQLPAQYGNMTTVATPGQIASFQLQMSADTESFTLHRVWVDDELVDAWYFPANGTPINLIPLLDMIVISSSEPSDVNLRATLGVRGVDVNAGELLLQNKNAILFTNVDRGSTFIFRVKDAEKIGVNVGIGIVLGSTTDSFTVDTNGDYLGN